MALKKTKFGYVGITPAGSSSWCSVYKPDAYENAKEKYKAKILLDPKDVKDFFAELDGIYDAEYKAMCEKLKKKKLKMCENKAWGMELDGDLEETGKAYVSANQVAVIETKNGPRNMKPVVVDAKRKNTKVWFGNGSKIVISFQTNPWYTAATGFGISLRLKGVQILEVVEQGAEDVMFEEQEGFVDEENSVGVDFAQLNAEDEEDDLDEEL